MALGKIAVVHSTAALSVLIAGCGGSDLTLPNQGVAAKIAVVKGDHQSAAISSTLPESLVVVVTDARNQPIPSQQVAFAVDAGGGALSPASAITNADGIARTRWTLGPTIGTQHVTAKPTGNDAPSTLSVGFTATATASAAAKVVIFAGNNQSAPVGTSVPTDPTVRVTDSQGNPVAGAAVTFAVTSGGGAVNPVDPVLTNSNGLAAASWTLGSHAGPNALTATVSGSNISGNPATFSATGTPGTAGKLVIVTQPPASGQSGVAMSPAPSVQLQDVNGNNVKQGGVAITAQVASGPAGASLAGATAATNNKGLATFNNLVLTGPAGQYTINFGGDNLSGVTSTPITLGAGGATRLVVVVAPSPNAQSGVPFIQQPQVQLEDGSGNPVAQPGVNVLVTISAQPAGGGTLGGGATTVQTGGDGIARFNGLSITGVKGQYTLLFASGNLTSTTAVVTVVNSAPTANPDAYSTNEDTPLNVSAPGVLGNDTDPNNDPLTAVLANGPTHATSFALHADGSFTYTPSTDYNGQDSFTYHASDGSLSSSNVTVTLTINPVNDPPSFTMANTEDQASTVTPQQETRVGWVTNISPGPADEVAAGQTVSFDVSTSNDNMFSVLPAIDASGTLTYTPALLASGSVTITVVARDSDGATSAAQTFTITLSPT